jgi:hypothetical protein
LPVGFDTVELVKLLVEFGDFWLLILKFTTKIIVILRNGIPAPSLGAATNHEVWARQYQL